VICVHTQESVDHDGDAPHGLVKDLRQFGKTLVLARVDHIFTHQGKLRGKGRNMAYSENCMQFTIPNKVTLLEFTLHEATTLYTLLKSEMHSLIKDVSMLDTELSCVTLALYLGA